MDFLLKLRTTAMRTPHRRFVHKLRIVADSLDAALSAFLKDPTSDRLIALNGAYAAAHRVWLSLPPDPPSGGGARAKAAA